MTSLVGARRVDTVLRERCLVEWEMDEQEDKRANAEPEDAEATTFPRAHEANDQQDREYDPRRRNPFDDPRGHSKGEAESGQRQKKTLRDRHKRSFPDLAAPVESLNHAVGSAFAGPLNGSDGTRTLDLRRDRLVPWKRRLATIDVLSLY
jgi:hypothetical protein